MKNLGNLLIFSLLVSGAGIAHATHGPDGCSANDAQCLAHLNADIEESNSSSLGVIALVALGVGVWALMRTRDKGDAKAEQLVAELKSGKGLALKDDEQSLRISLFPEALEGASGLEVDRADFGNLNHELEGTFNLRKPKALVGFQYKF